jgi:hypothetical protein
VVFGRDSVKRVEKENAMNMAELLRTWGGPQDTFEVVQTSGGNSEAWTAMLRLRGVPSFPLNVSKSAQDSRVWIAHRLDIPAEVNSALIHLREIGVDLPRIVSAIENARDGSVTCIVNDPGSPLSVDIRTVIYQDGFTQHALNMAVLEIARTRRALSSQFDETVRSSNLATQAQKLIQDGNRAADDLITKLRSSKTPQVERRCPNGHIVPAGKKFCSADGLPAQ